ncbi:hypothetical protein FEDK69T_19240 [Flavobacterium enshiense DK69]|uniref:Lipoprotein n=1 Tax=Flavobacterium enshiense DK69 TaxID=1107311 RepID=V6S7R0_9FLAO|nr:hypothetical protein [Flavobacterium enshiense]ESU22666.1 hypothetical protein FEDK69T_19240 [Flavobacterium enshiense DK69]KGO95632.1 hypothetical protein Q767_10425 [Flavobacterium enshiense DK69]
MKQVKFLSVLAISALLFVSCSKEDAVSSESDQNSKASKTSMERGTGNGAPSGTHYNLNIIGVPQNKTADMTGNNGGRIFVKLNGQSNIYLTPSTDGSFSVLDANGTDANGANFQLPAPGLFVDGVSQVSYTVFARALGKTEGSVVIRNCATFEGEVICETDTENILEMTRPKGKSTFTDVTRKLLYINVDITDDDRDNPRLYPIFDPAMEGYFWEYNDTGLKLLQLRFYPIPTTVSQ